MKKSKRMIREFAAIVEARKDDDEWIPWKKGGGAQRAAGNAIKGAKRSATIANKKKLAGAASTGSSAKLNDVELRKKLVKRHNDLVMQKGKPGEANARAKYERTKAEALKRGLIVDDAAKARAKANAAASAARPPAPEPGLVWGPKGWQPAPGSKLKQDKEGNWKHPSDSKFAKMNREGPTPANLAKARKEAEAANKPLTGRAAELEAKGKAMSADIRKHGGKGGPEATKKRLDAKPVATKFDLPKKAPKGSTVRLPGPDDEWHMPATKSKPGIDGVIDWLKKETQDGDIHTYSYPSAPKKYVSPSGKSFAIVSAGLTYPMHDAWDSTGKYVTPQVVGPRGGGGANQRYTLTELKRQLDKM